MLITEKVALYLGFKDSEYLYVPHFYVKVLIHFADNVTIFHFYLFHELANKLGDSETFF